MSTESTQISGRLCTLVTFEAVSSEAADESVGLLIAHSQYIRSHVPTCRTFRIHRFETKMMVYEEWDSVEEAKVAFHTEPFQALVAKAGSLLTKPLEATYWSEVTD